LKDKGAGVFALGDIPISVEYKRIKNLRMTVYPPDGRVCISAPVNTPQDVIRNFAASKITWIEKHRTRYRRLPRVPNSFLDDEVHYVWGVAYRLALTEREGKPKITLSGETMRMSVRPCSTVADRQALLDKFYRNMTGKAAPLVIKKWEPVIGVTVKKLYLRKMKTHWGSCNHEKQTIRLNTELARKMPECLEFVVVHEMIHLLEPRHNKAFYRLMNTYVPSWKIIRKKMNSGEI
jgi:predicted metal-dependent hydrolase